MKDVPDLALGEDVVRRLCDRVGVEVETEVPQELFRTVIVASQSVWQTLKIFLSEQKVMRRSPWWRRGPWRRDLRRPGPGCPWRRDGCDARARER